MWIKYKYLKVVRNVQIDNIIYSFQSNFIENSLGIEVNSQDPLNHMLNFLNTFLGFIIFLALMTFPVSNKCWILSLLYCTVEQTDYPNGVSDQYPPTVLCWNKCPTFLICYVTSSFDRRFPSIRSTQIFTNICWII